MLDASNDLDHLLVDLESNDSINVANVLRTIYENDNSEKFMKKLQTRILHHDQEIERMCSAHYKSFIDCIQELLQVRPSAESIKKETVEINTELMKSSDAAQRKAEELIRARRVLVNSSSSIELLKKCLFVLEQYSKFNEQLMEKKYFPALKTLEFLERDHLPTVSNYRFAQSMCKEIPKFRLTIKEASTQDLNDFLEGLLNKSQKIGETVLRSAESLLHMRRDNLKDASEDLSAISLVDFSPVYRGLHIFTTLGYRDQFDSYYREQRQKQSRLAFSPPTNMKSIKAYQDYLNSVIGFFIIEDHLMGTTKDFIRPDYLNELWLSAIQSMTTSLKQQTKLCHDASLMLHIKKLMMLFIFTIRNYGHDTDALNEILFAIREQYNEILMNQWQEKFEKIFRQDDYTPLKILNNDEYLKTVGSLSLFATDSVNFPKKFPFSSFVPKVYEEVKSFIEQSMKFSQDLNSYPAEVENKVRKSTNQLLTKTLGSCLTKLINDSSLNLLQLIQITINTDYLEEAMQFLDDHVTYQIGKSLFKDARAEAESQIYRKLNQQIDEILSLASYDWTLTEASGQASSYILDLTAWLKSTFQAFTNLPQPVAQGSCMSACKHIAQSLREFLLSDDVKSLSMGSLEQFNLDLIQCELFAGSEPVKGFKEGDLQMAFAELRQLLDLFIYEDYSTYISDMGKQQNKYLRVTTATALCVVDKLREYDRKKTVFALKKTDKQKLRDTFAKNLRQIQQQQTLQNQQYQQQQ